MTVRYWPYDPVARPGVWRITYEDGSETLEHYDSMSLVDRARLHDQVMRHISRRDRFGPVNNERVEQ